MNSAVTRLTCPHCGRVGKTTNEIPAGVKVKCPGCHASFCYQPPEQELSPPPMQQPLPPADNLNNPAPLAPKAEPAASPTSPMLSTPKPTTSPSDKQFDNHQKIGVWMAGVGLLVLGLSPFFKWINFGTGGGIGLLGDGKILLAGTVVGVIAYLSAVIKRRWFIPMFLTVQAWGTLAVFWMGALLWRVSSIIDSLHEKDNPFALLFAVQLSPGAGLYLGLIGGLAVAGALGFVVVRQLLITGNLKLFVATQSLSCLIGVLLAMFVGPNHLSKPKDVGLGSNLRIFGPLEGINEGKKGVQASNEPEEPKPTPAGQTLRRGDIEFDVDSAEITKVTKEDGYFMATFPEEPVLIVRFTVKNTSADKRYFYLDYIESLTDDLGNHYKYIQSVPRGLKEFHGFKHDNEDAINPGEIIKSSAVFERPLKSAKKIEMEIPGGVIARSPDRGFGHSEPSYRFVIPMDAVKQ